LLLPIPLHNQRISQLLQVLMVKPDGSATVKLLAGFGLQAEFRV